MEGPGADAQLSRRAQRHGGNGQGAAENNESFSRLELTDNGAALKTQLF